MSTLAQVRSPVLSSRAAFLLEASIIVSFLASSSAPTPLYAAYQAAWGFSPIVVTMIFGVYAIAVLVALLVFGALSDHVGRRPVLLVTTVLQALVMLVFAAADGVAMLMVARILQGLVTGAAVAALGAGMLDIDRARGSVANSVTPPLGTGTGGLISGIVVAFLPWPTTTVYLVFAAIFVLQAAGVALMPESVARTPGAWRSLKPHIELPATLRKPVFLVMPALVAAWAMAGLYGALTPTLMRHVTGVRSPIQTGLVLFLLAATAAATVFLSQKRTPRSAFLYGNAALIAGAMGVLAALTFSSTAAFLMATFVSGSGFGASFHGAMRSVVPRAAPHERAGVLSVLYITSYLAMGVPVVVAGFLLVYGGGVLPAARVFTAAVVVLSAVAFGGALRPIETQG